MGQKFEKEAFLQSPDKVGHAGRVYIARQDTHAIQSTYETQIEARLRYLSNKYQANYEALANKTLNQQAAAALPKPALSGNAPLQQHQPAQFTSLSPEEMAKWEQTERARQSVPMQVQQQQQMPALVQQRGAQLYSAQIQQLAARFGGKIANIPVEVHNNFKRDCTTRAREWYSKQMAIRRAYAQQQQQEQQQEQQEQQQQEQQQRSSTGGPSPMDSLPRS